MKISSAVIGFALLTLTTTSFAGVTRCKGNVEWGGINTQVQIDISLPEKIDGTATVTTSQGQTTLVRVGRGRIEVRESTNDRQTNSRISDLYITSLDAGIITGFFVEGVLIHVLRFSPKAKSLSFFDSFRERLITGACE